MASPRPVEPSDPFRPHLDAGSSPFADLRVTARVSALSTDVASSLNAFVNGTGNGRWPNLPRAQIAARLSVLAKDPSKLDQAGLNACGAAAAMYLFGRRRPQQFVDFVIELYEQGKAKFGTVSVSGEGLLQKDPAAMNWPLNSRPEPADWMILSSVLRSVGDVLRFSGEPTDAASGITLPSEMEKWLKDGIKYAQVKDETNHFFNKDLSHLKGLAPSADRDIVILINVSVIQGTPKKSKTKTVRGQGLGESILRQFPDHWFVLETPAAEQASTLDATGWSWGSSNRILSAAKDVWKDAYYGAMIAEV